MKQQEEEIICELGTTEDEVYKITKSFYLIIRAGPSVAIPVGKHVKLRRETIQENFPMRILPVDLRDPDEYEVIEKFTTVNQEDYWEPLRVGDILELSISEAIPLLRNRKIKIHKREGDEKR